MCKQPTLESAGTRRGMSGGLLRLRSELFSAGFSQVATWTSALRWAPLPAQTRPTGISVRSESSCRFSGKAKRQRWYGEASRDAGGCAVGGGLATVGAEGGGNHRKSGFWVEAGGLQEGWIHGIGVVPVHLCRTDVVNCTGKELQPSWYFNTMPLQRGRTLQVLYGHLTWHCTIGMVLY